MSQAKKANEEKSVAYGTISVSFASEKDEDRAEDGVEYVCNSSSKGNSHKDRQEFWETVAGLAGNLLEWYDFAVFGYFGDVIGNVFFPPQAGNLQLADAFCVFGVAFWMRPVGGILFGYIGDVYGRRKALVASIFLMAIPTFLMGCLPTYEQAGFLSIIVLIVARMLQGLSAGGQLMSAVVFTLERHSRRKWGFYGAFVTAAGGLGVLMGNLVVFVLRKTLSEEQVQVYGWRIAFWAGIIVSVAGFYLKHAGEEHEGDEKSNRNANKHSNDKAKHAHSSPELTSDALDTTTAVTTTNPVLKALARENRRTLLAACLVPMLSSAAFYLTFVWMATFMKQLSEHPLENAFGINACALLFAVLFYPCAGYASDYFGRVPTMTFGGIGLSLTSPIFLRIMGQTSNAVVAFISLLAFGILGTFFSAPVFAWLAESFGREARLTSVSIAYNVANAVVGGTTPAVATLLVDRYGPSAPGWIIPVAAVLSLSALHCASPSTSTGKGTGYARLSSSDDDVDKRKHVQRKGTILAGVDW